MHLSLLREYLDMEFNTLQDTLPFPYDLERIIDDFVLMCLFIGNDFLPHLPNLHIAEGALSLLFNVYKKLLPQLGGYFQDSGVLEPKRVEAMFHELAEVVEKEAFEAECDDLKYIGGKMAELLIVPNSGQKNNGKHRQGMRMGKPIENADELGKIHLQLSECWIMMPHYNILGNVGVIADRNAILFLFLAYFVNELNSDDKEAKRFVRPDQGIRAGAQGCPPFPTNAQFERA